MKGLLVSGSGNASVLRVGTISRHVRSAIGAPVQEGLLAAQRVDSSSRSWSSRSDALIVEMVLGPLLVKEGHEVGEKAGLSIGADAPKLMDPIEYMMVILGLTE